jgi:asparagine N-glycosylation enzyme membrane subunit Stt3
MVAVVTAVLAGAAVGQLAAILSGHSLVAALGAGAVIGIAALVVMMLYQRRAWDRAVTAVIFPIDEAEHG